MGKAILKCRVCGAEYEGCRTQHKADGIFRWNEVACCPEHGTIYLERIMASRGKAADAAEPASVSAPKKSRKRRSKKEKKVVEEEVTVEPEAEEVPEVEETPVIEEPVEVEEVPVTDTVIEFVPDVTLTLDEPSGEVADEPIEE